MSEKEVLVRGRDFTAYRIGGAIAALLLAVALAFQFILLLSGPDVTAPERHWGVERLRGAPVEATAGDVAPATGDNALPDSGLLAAEILRNRTRLQDERFRTGPSPDGDQPPLALEGGDHLTARPLMDGGRLFDQEGDRALTRAWASLDSDTGSMLAPGREVVGLSSLPYPNAPLFERPAARDWRMGMVDVATHLGAFAILGFSFLLALMLAIRGRVPIAHGKAHRRVRRFNFLERANHWMTAGSFIMLALTGLTIGYGDTLIRPFGEDVLGDAGWLATWGHPLFFPPFALGLLVMASLWTWRNLPEKLDWYWLKRGGGLFSDNPDNPPARKFNAGQKLIFWSAILGGGLMIATGVVLMFPYYVFGLEWMTWTMLTHAIVSVLLIAIFIGHIYIGTVGMQGAIDAMWDGDVDYNWAEEHHELWLKELEAKGLLDDDTRTGSLT
ncbi:formate dehydrogenase subunit gamma [Brevirhabdus pacifica]|uniref:Formate dehydrogenase subunit gamma n=1 Tax=Brevirhabdus pacifica TaxID=1267768 RepID=A0A1U7DKC4_9RHOB|nr:formate dehydrogenase subunit gamma [Brevirhabdus pacifica]APX90421.1 formate dehydrogenase subunit gamma [Brevirhabdus pacifica]PJJ85484.1 formate dehydrogenase gamma subunit [Brevirhabdus pacifica]